MQKKRKNCRGKQGIQAGAASWAGRAFAARAGKMLCPDFLPLFFLSGDIDAKKKRKVVGMVARQAGAAPELSVGIGESALAHLAHGSMREKWKC